MFILLPLDVFVLSSNYGLDTKIQKARMDCVVLFPCSFTSNPSFPIKNVPSLSLLTDHTWLVVSLQVHFKMATFWVFSPSFNVTFGPDIYIVKHCLEDYSIQDDLPLITGRTKIKQKWNILKNCLQENSQLTIHAIGGCCNRTPPGKLRSLLLFTSCFWKTFPSPNSPWWVWSQNFIAQLGELGRIKIKYFQSP